MPFNRRIGRRLQWIIGAVAGAVLTTTLWSTYRASRADLDAYLISKALATIRSAAREIDDFVLRAGTVPRALALRQTIAGDEPEPNLPEYVRQTPGADAGRGALRPLHRLRAQELDRSSLRSVDRSQELAGAGQARLRLSRFPVGLVRRAEIER